MSTPTPMVIAMVQALQRAGFTGSALVAMTSLGISESGGNPNALNDNPSTGDYSVGAFQVNYYNGLKDSRTAEFGAPDQLLGNLQAQADAAYKLSSGGQTFNPWKSDYSNGKYYANLPAAQNAVNAVLGGATAVGAPGGTGSATAPATATLEASDGCLISFPGIPLPSLGPIGGGSVGAGCLMSKTQGRHILGGLCILGGVVAAALGVVMFVKNENNPSKVMGGLKTSVSRPPPKNLKPGENIISDKEYNRRAGGKSPEEMKADSAALVKSKKARDKRNTFDARTGENHLGETADEVPF